MEPPTRQRQYANDSDKHPGSASVDRTPTSARGVTLFLKGFAGSLPKPVSGDELLVAARKAASKALELAENAKPDPVLRITRVVWDGDMLDLRSFTDAIPKFVALLAELRERYSSSENVGSQEPPMPSLHVESRRSDSLALARLSWLSCWAYNDEISWAYQRAMRGTASAALAPTIHTSVVDTSAKQLTEKLKRVMQEEEVMKLKPWQLLGLESMRLEAQHGGNDTNENVLVVLCQGGGLGLVTEWELARLLEPNVRWVVLDMPGLGKNGKGLYDPKMNMVRPLVLQKYEKEFHHQGPWDLGEKCKVDAFYWDGKARTEDSAKTS